jgi:phosphohistidine phosphatase
VSRTLILLRHGKSDWSDDVEDRGRPLAKRGRRVAKLAGEILAQPGLVPDVAVTSPALRATTTLELAVRSGELKCPVRVSEALYGGGPEAVLAESRSLPDEVAVAVFVGHEPTWSELVGLLVGGGSHRMPTGALAAVGFEGPAWTDAGPGRGELLWLLPPRLLGEA